MSVMRRKSKYQVQISNYGRLRSGFEYRKFWNGSLSNRFGACRFLLCRGGAYYDVIDLSRATWGDEFRGHRLVSQTQKLRAKSLRFRGDRRSFEQVGHLVGMPVSRLVSYVNRGLKVKGESVKYWSASPEKDPSSYYLPGEKWAFPKYGKCEPINR